MSPDVVDALARVLPADALVTDPAVIEGYRHDRATTAAAGKPVALVRPHDTAQVQRVVEVAAGPRRADRHPRRRHGPVRGRDRHRRRDHAVHRAAAHPVDRRDHDGGHGRARPAQRRGEGRRRRARAVVPAGSLVVPDLLDRRQPRHQRRRAVLRALRRDHRLRAGPRGGAGRRSGRAARRPHDQGRGRLRPQAAVRRLRGDPGHHHRGDPAPAAGATAGGHGRGDLRGAGRRGAGGRRGDLEPAPERPGADGPCRRARGRAGPADGAGHRRRGTAARPGPGRHRRAGAASPRPASGPAPPTWPPPTTPTRASS
jgi:hypothetical protein